IRIAHHPSGGRATATVYALNSDDKLGRAKSRSFRTDPSFSSLDAAANLSAKSAYQSGGAVVVPTQCPERQGHCQVRLELLLNGHVIARAGYQQAPDTFRYRRMLPSKPSVRRALRRALSGKSGKVRVVVRMHHAAGPATALASAP